MGYHWTLRLFIKPIQQALSLLLKMLDICEDVGRFIIRTTQKEGGHYFDSAKERVLHLDKKNDASKELGAIKKEVKAIKKMIK